MKILHIGDIHLGSSLENYPRNPELKKVLDAIVKMAQEEKAEAALLCGDIFDNGSPSNESQGMYFDFLDGLRAVGCRQIVVIAGNHDSPTFLDAPRNVLKKMDIHIVATVDASDLSQEVVMLGSAESPSAIVCAVPYLRAGDVRRLFPEGESSEEARKETAKGIAEHYRQVRQEAEKRRGERRIPLIGMGHLYASGSSFMSKKDEGGGTVGTLDAVEIGDFADGFDYIALGHLHQPQTVASHANWRYAGALLPMNVREHNYAPQVVVLDTDDLANPVTREIPYECYDRMKVVKGATVEELRQQLQMLEAQGSHAWVKPVYTGTEFVPNWAITLQDYFRDSPLRFVRAAEERPEGDGTQAEETGSKLTEEDAMRQATPEEIFRDTLKRKGVNLDDESGQRFLTLFHQVQEAALDPSAQGEAPAKGAGGLMRFKHLYLKNINSLYGENLIDFTKDAFKQGVFLIAGNTGAGKSSILDAICLALFGRTPRAGEITATQNPVMSDGTSEMMAELTFMLGEDEYRASFQQKRTKNAAKPFKNYEHKLFKNGVQMPLTPGEVKREVAKLIGMNHEQFTRCVLLAQGGFDAFLKADERSRADILMQITGTGDCNKIGGKIYEEFKKKKDNFETLNARRNGISLLSNEEKARLETTRKEAKDKKDAIERDERACDACEQNFQAVDEAAKQVQEAEGQLAKAKKTLEEAAPRQAELDDALRAQKCQEAYDARGRVLSEQSRLSNELKTKQEAEPSLQEAKEAAQKKAEEAGKQYDDAVKEQSNQQTLLQEVRALDIRIVAATQSHEEAVDNLNQLDTQQKALQRKFAQEEQDWKTAQKQAEEAQKHLEEHPSDNELSAKRENWELRRTMLVAEEGAIGEEESVLNKSKADLTQEEENLKTLQDKVEKASREVQTYQNAIKTAQGRQTELLNGKTLEELRVLEGAARKLGEFFSGALQREALLEPGKPCPLCGSTSHPYCEGVKPPEADYNQAADDLKARIAGYEQCDTAIRGATEKKGSAATRLASVQAEATALERNISKHKEDLQKRQESLLERRNKTAEAARSLADELERALGVAWTDHAALPKELDTRIDQYNQAQKAMDERAEHEGQFQRAKAAFDGENGQLETTLANARKEVQGKQDALEKLTAQRHEKFGEADVDERERALQAAVDEAQQAKEQAAQAKTRTEGDWSHNREAQEDLQRRLQEQATPLAKAQAALEAKLQECGFATVAEYEEKRRKPAEIQEWTAMLQQLKEAQTKATTTLAERQQRLKQCKDALPPEADRDANAKRLEALRADKAAAQQTIEELSGKLEADRQNRTVLERTEAEFQAAQKQYSDWDFLNRIFGTDGTPTHFGRLAQGYTFRRLLYFANHLDFAALSQHFTLVNDMDTPLDLNVLDHYRGQSRTAKNLSGGECFEVSLALALGLAKMSATSQNARLGNVLIDEGFGSLDGTALDSALDLLSQLNDKENKLVGIISHVERLQERIPAQIQVTNNNGMGRLDGAGVAKRKEAQQQWADDHPAEAEEKAKEEKKRQDEEAKAARRAARKAKKAATNAPSNIS